MSAATGELADGVKSSNKAKFQKATRTLADLEHHNLVVREPDRRDGRRSLLALTEAGLIIEDLHYANALGLIGYYLATSVCRLTPREGPMVKLYDRLVLPATRAAERLVRPPFGQSVFAVARVPG